MDRSTTLQDKLVSAIIPVHNGARFLAQAINSVLVQSYNPVELIVVDDGSTDGSAAIAQGYGTALRYFHQPRSGVARARNHGIEQACGELIAFLDCDDLWLPDKVARQAGFMWQNPQVQYTVTMQQLFLAAAAVAPASYQPSLFQAESVGMLPSSLMLRRGLLGRVGSFDAALPIGEDADWFFRAKDAREEMAVIPDLLLLRRIHEANLSHQVRATHFSLLKSARQSIHRRQPPQEQHGD